VVARAFTFEVGLQFAVVRAKLLRANPSNPAGMAAVAASEERIDHYIDSLGLRDLLAIAVYNGAEAHVVSGNLKAIETLLVAVKRDGLRCTKLNVDQGMILRPPGLFKHSNFLLGFHSSAIAPALPELKSWLDEHEDSFKNLEKPFFSTLRGKEIPKHDRLSSQYWVWFLIDHY